MPGRGACHTWVWDTLSLSPVRSSDPAGHATADALNRAKAQTSTERAALRARFMEASTAARRKGRLEQGVKWWLKYVVYGRKMRPWTELDLHSPLHLKRAAEELLQDFVIWLVTACPGGKQISAKTAQKYVQHVMRWHHVTFRTEYCGGLDSSVVTAMCKAAAVLVRQPKAFRRWGVRTSDLARAFKTCLSTQGEDVMWRAMLATGFCGLLRGGEMARQPATATDPEVHLMRSDLKFYRSAETGLPYAVLTIRRGKVIGAVKDTQVILGGGGAMIDAVQALWDMVAADPVPAEREATTPLFRRAHGTAVTIGELRWIIKLLMERIGLDPRRFGAHSLRIGGATAALAAGLSPAQIRAAGRWGSDVYQIYTRMSPQAAINLAPTIGSADFQDVERTLAFIDEDLTFTTTELRPADIRRTCPSWTSTTSARPTRRRTRRDALDARSLGLPRLPLVRRRANRLSRRRRCRLGEERMGFQSSISNSA